MPPAEGPPPHPLALFTAAQLELWRAARQWRSLWVTESSQALERFMRSPAFLELMGRGLSTMTRWAPFRSPFFP
jgi:hypothetical protein